MALTASVVGVGKMGHKHAEILAAMPDVTLGPLVDTDPDRAREVATHLDATTAALDDAIAAADCVFVCTPDDAHVAATTAAIEAGCHTFVEKPLATTTEDAAALRDAAAESDGVHMVGHVLRFDPRYRAVRDTVSDGDVGKLVSVTMERFVKRGRVRRTGGVSEPWMRLGVHDFDLLEWLAGERIASVGARDAPGALAAEGFEISEAVSVLATLSSGAPATLSMGFCLPAGHQGSVVNAVAAGTAGTATVEASGAETRLWDDEAGRAVDTHLWPEVAGVPDGALARQDRAFVDAVREGGPSPVPFSAGHRAVRVAEAVGRATSTGQRIDLPAP